MFRRMAAHLANVLFARELQRHAGTRLLSTTCHPGYARTNLNSDSTLVMKLAGVLLWPLSQGSARGVEPTCGYGAGCETGGIFRTGWLILGAARQCRGHAMARFCV
jgi:hypothetical protein